MSTFLLVTISILILSPKGFAESLTPCLKALQKSNDRYSFTDYSRAHQINVNDQMKRQKNLTKASGYPEAKDMNLEATRAANVIDQQNPSGRAEVELHNMYNGSFNTYIWKLKEPELKRLAYHLAWTVKDQKNKSFDDKIKDLKDLIYGVKTLADTSKSVIDGENYLDLNGLNASEDSHEIFLREIVRYLYRATVRETPITEVQVRISDVVTCAPDGETPPIILRAGAIKTQDPTIGK